MCCGGYDPDTLQRIIDERLTAQARAQQPMLLLEPRRPTKEESAGKVGVTNLTGAGGTTAAYLTARIARDRPDILERMKDGEFKSVRAAAIEAGIAKRRVSVPCDPIGAARIIKRHFDGDQIGALIDALIDADHT